MNKTCVQIAALVIIPCLITGQVAKPAFSDAQVPWQGGPKVLCLNGWVANFNAARAVEALKNCPMHLSEMSIFGVGAKSTGELAPETEFIDLALAATRGLKVRPRLLLTVTNIRPRHNQDHWLIRHWLGTPDKWRQHTTDLLKLAGPVDGLDIDYENLRVSDGPRFSQFAVYLGQALHAQGKVLTLTVEHQAITDGIIDWKAVSPHVDRVRVMAYQYHYDKTGPGAISPPAVVVDLATRALKEIPAGKLEIALPLYGFDWARPGPVKLVKTLGEFRKLAHRPGARAFREASTRAARITYFAWEGAGPHKRRVRHEVWFEDTRSVAYKVRRLQRLGIYQIGLWQMAVGDLSGLFALLKTPPFSVPS